MSDEQAARVAEILRRFERGCDGHEDAEGDAYYYCSCFDSAGDDVRFLTECLDAVTQERDAARQALRGVSDVLAALRGLRSYARHAIPCYERMVGMTAPCDCGFAETSDRVETVCEALATALAGLQQAAGGATAEDRKENE